MKIKKVLYLFTAIIVIAVLCFAAHNYVNHSYKQVSFNSSVFTESSDIIQNPYQGFYHLYGFSLTDDTDQNAIKLAETITKTENNIVLLEINLKNFRNDDLSENALTQLETLITNCENASKKLILRFLYDWDGKAKDTEPDDISQIISHMNQIAPIVNLRKNTVYIIQGIFVGNCGEMNGSNYMSKENMLTLINHLDECIDKDIFLSVRTPQHYRIINDCTAPPNNSNAFSKTLPYRLGLFNDGMLGSDIDLGTYGTSSFAGSANPADKGTRAEEILFQNKLCNFVPNGGECVIDNPFNDFENAVNDLKNMHVSYLNCDYDMEVLNKWRSSTYNADDIFYNTNGYDYIAAHLGYRYFVKNCAIEYKRFKSKNAVLKINIKNTGFASAYKKFTSKIIIVGDSINEYEADFDNRLLFSDSEASISINISTAALDNGSYKIYLSITDNSSNPPTIINLANDNFSAQDKGLFLGELIIK